jgi:[acyl-carrier-protein] S-malonyltransferase
MAKSLNIKEYARMQAWIFPGQGSQTVGMGKALAEAFPSAREVFQEVDDALNQKLSTIIFEGPEDQLTLTENAQPAIMASSLAIARVLEKEMGVTLISQAQFVAGHSLGEYSALAAAGTFSLSDTARLLKTRGQAMQAAVPAGQGGMAAVIGMETALLEEVVKQAAEEAGAGEVCVLANYNSPGQVVISGSAKAIARACELAKEKGAKRALPLAVSAPFHSPLMAPAAKVMEEALCKVQMRAPAVPLVANVNAAIEQEAARIRSLLVEQVTGAVRWEDSMRLLAAQGVTRVVEIGVGKVLSGLMKRIAPEVEAVCIAGPEDLDGFAKLAA